MEKAGKYTPILSLVMLLVIRDMLAPAQKISSQNLLEPQLKHLPHYTRILFSSDHSNELASCTVRRNFSTGWTNDAEIGA
jgi:hypothetical protein